MLIIPKCRRCKYFKGSLRLSNNGHHYHSCSAFPLGIPRQIMTGKVIHTKVFPEQEEEFVYEATSEYDQKHHSAQVNRLAEAIKNKDEKLHKLYKQLKVLVNEQLKHLDWKEIYFEKTLFFTPYSYLKTDRPVHHHFWILLNDKNVIVPENTFWKTNIQKCIHEIQILHELDEYYSFKRNNTIVLIIQKDGTINTSFAHKSVYIEGKEIEEIYDSYPPINMEVKLPTKEGHLVSLLDLRKKIVDLLILENSEERRPYPEIKEILEDLAYKNIDVQMIAHYQHKEMIPRYGPIKSKLIQDTIKNLIDAEDKKKPLSDERIKNKLRDLGYDIARRSVAKIRETMNIPVARIRKANYIK